MYCQVDYKLNNYFYTLTAYDIDYCSGDKNAITAQICKENNCEPTDLEILWDSLFTYEG